MSRKLQNNLGQFGTTPVFIASISTILGAILFLRFGYAVGNVGFFGAIAIIILGHAVTIPTALAVKLLQIEKLKAGVTIMLFQDPSE